MPMLHRMQTPWLVFRCVALVLLLWSALGNAAEKFPGTGRMNFFGYTDCVFLANDTTRVVLCHQAGARVLEYSRNGKNTMWLDPAQEGWVLQPGAPTVDLCGGRLDIGPEMIIPRRPALWHGPWLAEITGPRT